MKIVNRNTDQRVVNIDPKTGIHYGVIPQNRVLQAWCDSSEPNYGKPEEAECPECHQVFILTEGTEWGDEIQCPNTEVCGIEFTIEIPDCVDPLSFYVDNGEYLAECGEDGDIFILKSPFYTRCRLCSPCAPNAGYLLNPDPLGVKTYCFGSDWFDPEEAPYPLYRVKKKKIKGGE
jgi:hypothetical protein